MEWKYEIEFSRSANLKLIVKASSLEEAMVKANEQIKEKGNDWQSWKASLSEKQYED